MPISLSQLTANRKACVVTFEDVGELHVEYCPQRLTAQMMADFVAADVDNIKALPAERVIEVMASPVKALAELLHSWDLTAVVGGPVLPIDEATLSGLGLPILWDIVRGIMQDGGTQGKSNAPADHLPKKRLSGAGSSRKAR